MQLAHQIHEKVNQERPDQIGDRIRRPSKQEMEASQSIEEGNGDQLL